MVLAWTAIGWLLAAAWVFKLLEAMHGLTKVPNLLERAPDLAPAGEPRLAVIVPARDEAENVEACLRSLAEQDYEKLHVVAVDDRSRDKTYDRIRVVAEEYPNRVEAISIAELPVGWLGKTHAMSVGASRALEAARVDFLLFTDADIVFARSAIRLALACAVESDADHFVLLPTTTVKTFGEGMLLSFLQVMSLWAIRPWRVSDPRAKRDAIGVGAFNLVRAETYEKLGGFEAARMEILEDLNLGGRVKLAGLRQRVATGPGLVQVHWAAGALGIVAGMTKNLFAVFRFRSLLLLAAAASLALFTIGPAICLVWPQTRVAGLVVFAAAFGLYGLSSRTSRISPGYAILFPLAGAVVVYSMLRSMLVTVIQRGVTWRGTFYPLPELRTKSPNRPE